MELINFLSKYNGVITAAIIIILLIYSLVILCMFVRYKRLKKRFDYFMGANRRPEHSLEALLKEQVDTINEMNLKYNNMANVVNKLNECLGLCAQKVGLVRYNPYEGEIGGDLSFALAILDRNDTGIVLNGIYGRTGSFTYAKPIEMGTSTYALTGEEMEAIELAKKSMEVECDKILSERRIKVYRVASKPKKSDKPKKNVIELKKPQKENKVIQKDYDKEEELDDYEYDDEYYEEEEYYDNDMESDDEIEIDDTVDSSDSELYDSEAESTKNVEQQSEPQSKNETYSILKKCVEKTNLNIYSEYENNNDDKSSNDKG